MNIGDLLDNLEAKAWIWILNRFILTQISPIPILK